jgi:hypothetical protein
VVCCSYRSAALAGLAEGTAQSFVCSKCNSFLGAFYVATLPGFDFLRHNWSLDPNRVTKFTLGSPKQTLVWFFDCVADKTCNLIFLSTTLREEHWI